MFPTTSTREGIERSPDTTADLMASLDAVQSQCSAPLSLTAMNSIIKNGSELPKTTQAHFWRHLFSSRMSKMVYSTNFSRYTLQANSMYVSPGTYDPPLKETSDTEEPTTLRRCPRTTVSPLASPMYLLSTDIHTVRNVSRSHVRTNKKMVFDPSSNSTPNWPNDLAQPTTRVKVRGNIPLTAKRNQQ